MPRNQKAKAKKPSKLLYKFPPFRAKQNEKQIRAYNTHYRHPK